MSLYLVVWARAAVVCAASRWPAFGAGSLPTWPGIGRPSRERSGTAALTYAVMLGQVWGPTAGAWLIPGGRIVEPGAETSHPQRLAWRHVVVHQHLAGRDRRRHVRQVLHRSALLVAVESVETAPG